MPIQRLFFSSSLAIFCNVFIAQAALGWGDPKSLIPRDALIGWRILEDSLAKISGKVIRTDVDGRTGSSLVFAMEEEKSITELWPEGRGSLIDGRNVFLLTKTGQAWSLTGVDPFTLGAEEPFNVSRTVKASVFVPMTSLPLVDLEKSDLFDVADWVDHGIDSCSCSITCRRPSAMDIKMVSIIFDKTHNYRVASSEAMRKDGDRVMIYRTVLEYGKFSAIPDKTSGTVIKEGPSGRSEYAVSSDFIEIKTDQLPDSTFTLAHFGLNDYRPPSQKRWFGLVMAIATIGLVIAIGLLLSRRKR